MSLGTGVPVTTENIDKFASRSPALASANAAGNGDRGGRYDDVGDNDAGEGVRL